MARLIVHDEAKAETREAARWYEQQQEDLGKRFLNAVRSPTQKVRTRPHLFRQFDGPFRRYIIKGFPYAVIYAVRDDVIYVLAVMHMKRKPGYWKQRWSQFDSE